MVKENTEFAIPNLLEVYKGSVCSHCGGRVIAYPDEVKCLMCGKTNYLPLETLDVIPRPAYKEELITSLDQRVFMLKYKIVNRALLSRLPKKGSETTQPYASCLGIKGPIVTLKGPKAIENLKKGFYRSTALRLHNLEVILNSQIGKS